MSSSPTDRKGDLGVPDIRVPVYLPDGRRLHRFRQSSLKDIDICMERARFEMSGLMPKVENDAANVGTAVHAGIELALTGLLEDGVAYPFKVTNAAAQAELTQLMASPEWRWVKFTETSARWFVSQCLLVFHEAVLPTLRPLGMELSFGPLVLHEDEQRVIEVTGTIDYLDAVLGLMDWKTGSRKWDGWEHERWDIQPSIYSWAATETGLVVPAKNGIVPFTFVVFWKKNNGSVELQTVKVERHRGDWEWIRERTIRVAELIESGMEHWPLNDNHALCSPKWCPAWDQCKGRHYSQWPRPSRPSPLSQSQTD